MLIFLGISILFASVVIGMVLDYIEARHVQRKFEREEPEIAAIFIVKNSREGKR